MNEVRLGRAEPRRQFLSSGLLDHPGAREREKGPRLGKDDVSKRGEAGKYPSCGGMGQYRDERQTAPAQGFKGDHGLRHLHQREYPLLHARAAGRRHNDEGHAVLHCPCYQTSEGLTHYGAHGPAQKTEIHDTERHAPVTYGASACHERFGQTRLVLCFLKSVRIRPGIEERKGIQRAQLPRHGPPTVRIGKLLEPLPRADGMMVRALWADSKGLLERGGLHRMIA